MTSTDEAVARLFNMGFTTDACNKALVACNHDFDQALEWLIKNASSSSIPRSPSNANGKKKRSKPSPPPSSSSQSNGHHRRVQSLLALGFEEQTVLTALKMHQNNVQQSIDYLLANPISENASDANGAGAASSDVMEDDFILINDDEEKKKDAEWQQISANEVPDINPWDMELVNDYECTLLSPFKLKQIISKCPTRTHLNKWQLIYDTEQHGISITTVYAKMKTIEQGFVILINDAANHVFGAFIDCEWVEPKSVSTKTKYKGSVDCFVFHYVVNAAIADKDKKQLRVYKSGGNKPYFFRNDAHTLMIGAGECPAIYFDFDFAVGRSVKCDTFNSPPLTSKAQFKIKKIEIWAPSVAE